VREKEDRARFSPDVEPGEEAVMRVVVAGLCAVALAMAAPLQTSGASGPRYGALRELPPSSSCADLAKLALSNGKVTLAEPVEAGAFRPPDQGDAYRSLPAFCRVAVSLTPSSDSDINVEIWIPAANWNGKFQAVGNGAFNGNISYPAMARALAQGYATSSTDTGHTGGGARWASGHPEKVVDFGWRAVHEMTVAAKKIIASHTGSAPAFSYWNGCSAGGRQAMKEAQRFPDDFNGIIAGAPGLDWTGRAAQALRVAKALEHNEAARLSSAHAQVLHRAVVDACDAGDGLKDGLISDPPSCRFDPGVLQCKGSDRSGCLTPVQVETARLMYSPGVNASTKREISGLFPGSELGWTDMGWTASARATGLDQFRFLVFNDPAWDIQKFNFDRDLVRAEEADRDTLNALDPNLQPFIDHGGKLIQFHGWADPQISPGNSTQYHKRVVETLGGADKVHRSYRLFMAPGMGHCSGGEGPNTFDMVAALEQWVEHGKGPDRILASHATNGVVDRTRPLCAYPQVAAYTGTGSVDDAANFVCRSR
jgi:feruloyl esterase